MVRVRKQREISFLWVTLDIQCPKRCLNGVGWSKEQKLAKRIEESGGRSDKLFFFLSFSLKWITQKTFYYLRPRARPRLLQNNKTKLDLATPRERKKNWKKNKNKDQNPISITRNSQHEKKNKTNIPRETNINIKENENNSLVGGSTCCRPKRIRG